MEDAGETGECRWCGLGWLLIGAGAAILLVGVDWLTGGKALAPLGSALLGGLGRARPAAESEAPGDG